MQMINAKNQKNIFTETASLKKYTFKMSSEYLII